MPIHEFGYRHWEGKRRHPLLRWCAITRIGMRLAVRSKLLRRFLFVAWGPLLYFGPLFFLFGYLTDPGTELARHGPWAEGVRAMFGDDIAMRLQNDPESIRPTLWAMTFYYFFAFSQTILIMVVVAIVGPPLISRDLRNKAFLIYFSKPIGRADYLFGKGSVVVGFVFAIGLLPALLLYGVSIAFSPSMGTILDTWTVLASIFAAALVEAVPITLIVLFLSSLTTDERFAVFGWVAIWLLGEITFLVLSETRGLGDAPWIFLTSIRQTQVVVIHALFDVSDHLATIGNAAIRHEGADRIRNYSPALAIGWLAFISGVSLVGVLRRISAPMRV